MNYSETVSYLQQAEKYGIIPGLESIRRLMKKLSDPQDRLKIVHIAGTNGKGSAGRFISSILSESGYRTGRFITPAVMDPLEIIQLNDKNISADSFSKIMTKIRKAADSVENDGFPHPTLFEMQTAAAFTFFEESMCDIVLVEAGMGGTYDATNVIKSSILSVITSISADHMKFLGDTPEKIAEHKAGIIKNGGKVVTISQNPKVTEVIINTCNDRNAELKIAKIYNISDYRYENCKQYFRYEDLEIILSMAGKYQTENAILAVEACRMIAESGFSISVENIKKGLEKAEWPGRFEIINSNGRIFVLDGAHNESAASRLRESIDICFSDKRLTFIIGTFSDKNYHETVKLTVKRAEKIYTVTAPGPRGLPAEELAETVREYNSSVFPADSVEEAVRLSLEDETDAVIAFGSLSFLSRIRNIITSE